MKPANKKYLADARRAAYKGDVDILRMTLAFNHDYSQRTQQLPVPNAEKLVCNMSILDMAVIGRKPFSCSKLIFKHYRDNQDMLEKLFQQDGKHTSLHLGWILFSIRFITSFSVSKTKERVSVAENYKPVCEIRV